MLRLQLAVLRLLFINIPIDMHVKLGTRLKTLSFQLLVTATVNNTVFSENSILAILVIVNNCGIIW